MADVRFKSTEQSTLYHVQLYNVLYINKNRLSMQNSVHTVPFTLFMKHIDIKSCRKYFTKYSASCNDETWLF